MEDYQPAQDDCQQWQQHQTEIEKRQYEDELEKNIYFMEKL